MRIARRRSASVHCSAKALRVLRKLAQLVSTAWMTERLTCMLVIVRRVCLARCVCVAM
jgi:hypothetical protein